VQLQLTPGDDLHGLIQRAQAPGQGDEGVGQVEHPALARVHAVRDQQFGQPVMRHLPLRQELRDHADDLAAGGQRAVRHRTHQPDAAAAVDQPHRRLRQAAAQRIRSRVVDGQGAAGCAAEDRDRMDVRHFMLLVLTCRQRTGS